MFFLFVKTATAMETLLTGNVQTNNAAQALHWYFGSLKPEWGLFKMGIYECFTYNYLYIGFGRMETDAGKTKKGLCPFQCPEGSPQL